MQKSETCLLQAKATKRRIEIENINNIFIYTEEQTMMIDPPIDKLIKHAECRYALTVAVAKRARELATTESNYLESSGLKPISLACKEIYDDKIKIVRD